MPPKHACISQDDQAGAPREGAFHDPFAFLEDVEDPRTQTWLQEEHGLASQAFDQLHSLRRELFGEMRNLMGERGYSARYRIGPYLYYERFEEGLDYAVHLREKAGKEQVVFNPNGILLNGKAPRPGSLVISPDSEWAVFTVDAKGSMSYTLGIRHIESGRVLADTISGITPEVVWGDDSRVIFYTVLDPSTQRPYQIKRHVVGGDPDEDDLIYQEPDPAFNCYVRKTRDQRFLLIYSNSANCDEVRYLPVQEDTENFRVFCPRSEKLKVTLQHHDNQFFIHTNYLAPNYRLMIAPAKRSAPSEWLELIPHRPGILLGDFRVLRDYLVLAESTEGLTRMRVRYLPTAEEHQIKFPEPAYKVGFGPNSSSTPPILGLEYASINQPPATFAYHLEDRTLQAVGKRKRVSFDSARFRVERLEVPTRDGLTVPVTLAYRRDLVKNGSAPALVYGYGAYGHTVTIDFKPGIVALLNRGFVYAVVHVRGGGCRGAAWYSAGKLRHKCNSFNDFLDGTDYLVQQSYADPDNLFAMGESAGGLLIGAVLNLAPNRFKGAVLRVPFVDVLAAMNDPELPLTSSDFAEWGDPRDPEDFACIRGYSPYQNVKAQAYPHLLVTTGFRDTRVPFWQACKWVARLKAMKTDDRRILLNFAMDRGHQGRPGRYERVWDKALEYAFLLHHSGKMGIDGSTQPVPSTIEPKIGDYPTGLSF